MARIQPDEVLTIGDVAKRSGATVPTLRYYEQRGLIDSSRTAGNQRLYARHTLRRLAVIAAGKRVGLTLEQISGALSTLPRDRAPSQRDWTRMSRSWADLVARRIAVLQQLAVDLDGCIGCGCLSLGRCTLFNPTDEAAGEGPGSRWLRNAETASAVRAPPS